MTILIKNIQLIDGTGKASFQADILVKNERIAAIGNFPNYKADQVIDGLGAHLAPGFIDIHNNSDRYLAFLSNPLQNDYLSQGVTTIIGGQCGVSLAPLIYGSLESIKEWASIRKINIDWHTMSDFFSSIKKRKIGVNFGSFVGHSTVRDAIVGDSFRDLTKNELHIINSILETSIKHGAFGVSFGLGKGTVKKTSYSEIKNIMEMVSKLKSVGVFHLRDEKRDILNSVNEIINLSRETNSKILISHFRPLIGFADEYDKATEAIDKNLTKAHIYFDLYPNNYSTALIQSLLPAWTQGEDHETILKDIETPGIKEKILRELPRFNGEDVIVMNAPGHEYLIGKNLKEFSENRNLSLGQGLLTLIKITKLRATILYKNIKLKRAISALCHERAIVASNSASFEIEEGLTRYRGIKKPYAFQKTLELVEKQNLMPIELAIHKMTGLPAKIIGLKERGTVREGNYADLVVFRGSKILEVIINGKRAVKESVLDKNILAGQILKRK